MTKFNISIIVVAFVLLNQGCKDGSTGPQLETPSLQGSVVDDQGKPIVGAAIHCSFVLVQNALSKQVPSSTEATTVISYTVPHAGHVQVSLLRWYTREVLLILVDAVQQAGRYIVGFDAARFTNGIYLYRIVIDTSTNEGRFMLQNPDTSSLFMASPLATTNEAGRFVIPTAQFGFGVPLVHTSGAGDTNDTIYVSHTFSIFVVKPAFQTFVQTVTLPDNESIARTIVLSK